jgi:hypothetical protein
MVYPRLIQASGRIRDSQSDTDGTIPPQSSLMCRSAMYRVGTSVRREDRDAWLNGTVEQARDALTQYPSELMVAYEVSTRVNSVKNNDPGLLEPVDRKLAVGE